MTIHLFLLFLCILVLGEIGFPARAFNNCGTQSTSTHLADFLNLDMPLPSDADIRRDENNETIIFLRGDNLSEGMEGDQNFRMLQSKNSLAEITLAYLTAHRSAFKLMRPSQELSVSSVTTDDLGLTHIKFQQVFESIPVWASEIIVHLNQANQVVLMQGRYIPTPENVATRPVLNEGQAFRMVAEDLKNIGPDCRNCRSELIIFAQSEGGPRLAYRVLAPLSVPEGWAYVIDAETGEILEKLPTVYNGGVSPMQIKERRID